MNLFYFRLIQSFVVGAKVKAMKVHPKQLEAVYSHIKTAWPKGCECRVCQAVDRQENITAPPVQPQPSTKR